MDREPSGWDEAALPQLEPRTGGELARSCLGIAWFKNVIPNYAELTDPIFAALLRLRARNRDWKHVLLNEQTGWTAADNLRLIQFQAVVLEYREETYYQRQVD
eukprot:GHVU01166723.1.p2 GENE.GHVU01166723.1~~GHVU01166723.1.p2  ORF type:complete len:103 (+),score=11.30 GHVU01166723.1:250-558(+)